MAYFAQLNEQNEVLQVIIVNDDVLQGLSFPDSEPLGVAFCRSLLGDDSLWKQTSYECEYRKNFAHIGCTYDATYDAFIPAQPAPNWTFDPDTCNWIEPVPAPTSSPEVL